MMAISEQDLKALDECDEYSLRHYGSEVQELIDSYRELVYLIEDAGVLQLDDEWAKGIQAHIGDVEGRAPQ